MVLPWSDGDGFLPDTKAELAADFVIIIFIGFLFAFFTGLDAQVAYALGSPGQYFSTTSDADTAVKLSSEQINNINFVSKNRIGFVSNADEIGMCGGIRNSGEVYDLRLAEEFEETSRTSVKFSCKTPRSIIFHSQPDYSGDMSVEDRSFDGEFKPDTSCIVYGELAASPVNSRVDGLNCWNVNGDSFEKVAVVLQG